MSFVARLGLSGQTVVVNGSTGPITEALAHLALERGAAVSLSDGSIGMAPPPARCLLVNMVLMAPAGPLESLAPAEWDTLQRSVLRRAFEASRSLLPLMCEQRAGAIVNVVSAGDGAATAGIEAAMIGFTRALAREGAPLGARVNAVRVGIRGRLAAPEASLERSVAEAVLFLLSDAAGYVTGETVTIGDHNF